MFQCPRCAKSNKDNSRFCENCGARLQPETVPKFYAGFWRRVAASLLDSIMLILSTVIASAIIFEYNHISAWFYIITGVCIFLYYGLMESSPLQATMGKIALGIMVTDLQFKRLDFLHSLRRTLSKYLSGITLIGMFFPLFTEQKQALHDRMAGTLVITRQAFEGGWTQKAWDSQIDINNCREEQLAALPGIGPILAKKAVMKRDEIGGFCSLEEFGEVLGLQSGMIERLHSLAIVNQKDKPKKETKQAAKTEAKKDNKGRIIDV